MSDSNENDDLKGGFSKKSDKKADHLTPAERKKSAEEVMRALDNAAENAQENGLTEDILDDILGEYYDEKYGKDRRREDG